MNLRDALLAGSEHGTDRMSVASDRRLRRRLGLESAPASRSARRVWLAPALAACAVAAVVAVVIMTRPSSEPASVAAAGFVDVSKTRWDGTVTTDTIEVRADSPVAATVMWRNIAIIAAPDTRLTAKTDGVLVLSRGAIQIDRADITPQIVDVPQGRVLIASYRSSIAVDRETVTISLDDGSGHFIDAEGQIHTLSPGVPLVSPPPPVPSTPETSDGSGGSNAPVRPPAPRRERPTPLLPMAPLVPNEPSGPPGVTPAVPLRPDAPCTFKSDCDPGATCRKNETGASVCMGNGAEGAACWFDTDCLSHRCVRRHCGS